MRTLGEALRTAAARLEAAGVASPANDARLIAAHLLGCAPLNVALHTREAVPEGFDLLVDKRCSRVPLQHLLGTAPMGALDLRVGPGVFIPRPETEVLAEWAVRQRPATVVDLCTGSGAIAAYIAHELVDASVTAVELDPGAARWAARNLEELAPGVNLVIGDATDPGLLPELHGGVDLVVSNPPYVPETGELEPEVYRDPHMAVFSGESGMDVIEKMVDLIHALLRSGGRTGVEHDDSTSEAVQQVFLDHGGFGEVRVMRDLAGRARFVTASKL
ncbi:peptide chain release factor N(5)-glutamine methyltransferase [Corynebacterium pacaense]|uniref:peptide chain release factor N(5)-glutamine methyltransferase n=1 Tax=Corynebacterium pacaense TaxID=1816684 RepID=UPI0009BB0272|nr:peptide chain release factor N(5)-glutamine methyltransferase [Corynebacterium pacaense]